MKQRMTVFIALLFVLAGGGFVTALFTGSSINDLLPFLVQTSDPEASLFVAEPWQAEQIFLLVGFILFNMIGIGATLAVIMWMLNRGVAEARAQEAAGGAEPATESE